jgi:hypothetical protein
VAVNRNIPPQAPSPDHRERLRRLAALHRRWVRTHVAGSGFHPRGTGSDYNVEHLDVDGASATAEDAFHEQARQIMGIADTSRSLTPTEEDEVSRALDGDEFEAYWTRGEGLPRWAPKPHPWRTLRRLLRKHPEIRDPEGLASHYYHIVFKMWPGERKGANPVGPG